MLCVSCADVLDLHRRAIRSQGCLISSQEGSGYPDLPIPGIRAGRNAAWEEWAEDGADREQLIKVVNDLSQGIPNISLGTWKGEQGSEREGEGSKPVGDGRQFECSAGECV